MATAIAWLLNLDAELELADPRRYRPSPALLQRIAALLPRLARLVSPIDGVLERDACTDCARALAFSPTPSALARITRAGFAPPRAPDVDLLARVNSRSFCAGLGQTLAGAGYVRSMEELSTVLTAARPERPYLLKRDFGFAGRERRRAYGPLLDTSTEGFARRAFSRGEGLQVEPLLGRTADFAQHGFVLQDGRLLLGAPASQECDAKGVWIRSRELVPGELDERERLALEASTLGSGKALSAAGYFGPFGVDAYRYDDPQHGRCFQPRSEINARFSMGYPRELLERALASEPDAARV